MFDETILLAYLHASNQYTLLGALMSNVCVNPIKLSQGHCILWKKGKVCVCVWGGGGGGGGEEGLLFTV